MGARRGSRPPLAGTVLLGGLLSLTAQAGHADDVDRYPAQPAAAYLLLRDDVVLAARQADAPLPMASLTKLMTALLVLDSRSATDAVVTIHAAAAAETGTRLGLRAGEHLSLHDLLAAMIIGSANDACHALASHLAGSEAAFVRRMNQRAVALGLRATHFTNACGHDQSGHHSSARDLATLAVQVMRDPTYRALAATPVQSVASLDAPARQWTLHNSNRLLGHYPGVAGLKTGTTPAAGRCLVVLALQGEHVAVLVLLDAPDRWWTAADLLDAALPTPLAMARTPLAEPPDAPD